MPNKFKEEWGRTTLAGTVSSRVLKENGPFCQSANSGVMPRIVPQGVPHASDAGDRGSISEGLAKNGGPTTADPAIWVFGCSNATVSKWIEGTYTSPDESPPGIYRLKESNHGKPVYKKQGPPDGMDVFIYYWDSRDGSSFRGWWFGPEVGGEEVWAYNAGHPRDNPELPPTSNWKVHGEVDESLRITITLGVGSDISRVPEGSDEKAAELQEKVRHISQALSAEQAKRELAEGKLKSLEGKVRDYEAALAHEREKWQTAEKQVNDMQHKLKESSEENLRLQTALQEHTSNKAVSQGVNWQYQDYKVEGSWYAFPPDANDQLHHAYLAFRREPTKHRFAAINSGGVALKVDFHSMLFGRSDVPNRKMRILTGMPKEWVLTPASFLEQFNNLHSESWYSYYVKVDNQSIHGKVEEILRCTGHAGDDFTECSCMRQATIKSVHRIENVKLWQRYRARRDALRQDSATASVTPASLDQDAFDTRKVMTCNQSFFDCGEELAKDVDEKILLHGSC
ncbi:unnamed protein product [Durusdinium trenchii]|uniref:WWE domain-containing protein n=1 Tax=Durusdinium trenchii TaxID=1381693 RepID=A0ABP0QAB3_9DINO